MYYSVNVYDICWASHGLYGPSTIDRLAVYTALPDRSEERRVGKEC